MPTLASQLGDFASQFRYDDIPCDVVDLLKLRVLDLIGSAVAGIGLRSYEPFLGAQAKGGAICWATGEGTSARDAAFLNSFVSHASYLEDGSRFTGGHPASIVIPAAIALADDIAASGRQVLLSMLVGYEVFLRLGQAVYPDIVRKGMQSTAVLGALGSAAASASMRGLGPGKAAHALAIAANLGFGLKEALKSSQSQPVQVARACEGGVLAAYAAEKGAKGAPAILEAALLPLCGATGDFTSVTDCLGQQFRASHTYVKIHGGCRGNHAPLDLVSRLIRQAGIGPEMIDSIEISVDSVTHASDIDEPTTAEQAQFSVRFALAVKLLKGDALPARYNAAELADEATRGLMGRITVRAETALDACYPDRRGAVASIRLVDGREMTGSIENALGEPESPITGADIEAKFFALTDDWFGPDAKSLRDLVLNLDRQEDMRELSRILAQSARRALTT